MFWILLAKMPRNLIAVALMSMSGPLLAEPITNSSPIDIRAENTRYDPNLAPLVFNYGSAVDLTLINTGSPDEEATVRADFARGAGSLTVGGVTYDLLQFHFHVEGEHAINGVRAAMELHQVHQASDGTLAVVARLLEEGPENELLARIFDRFPGAEGETTVITAFDLAGLVGPGLSSYRHGGSLTTFPFTGGVRWNVLADPLFLSAEQIDTFRSLFPEGNARELQPFADVAVTDVVGFAAAVPEPTTWAMMVFGFGIVGTMARRQRRSVVAA